MCAMQRFLTIMSVFFFVCGVVSLWRILAVRARSMGRKNTQNED